jgi:hypothetical protein
MLALVLAATLAASDAGVASAITDAGSPGSRTLVLGPAQMFRLAEIAEGKSDLAMAFAIYAALEGNPNGDIRAEARFRQAKALMRQSRNREAAVLLRRVLDDKPNAVGVRLELARQLQLLGEPDAAWREVRAIRASRLPPEAARLVDRYSEALRAARPAGASLEIALAPDSNINHATRSDTLGTVIGNFDIGDDAKAKSGTGVALQGQVYRRLRVGHGDANLLARASGFADLYRKARFNDIALDFAAGPELQLGGDRLNLEAGVLQHWYGQKPFIRGARLGASYSHPLGLRSLVRLNASAMLLDNRMNDLEDGKDYSAQAQFEHALSATTGVALSLSGDRQSLKDAGYSTTAWRGGLTGWRELGRVTVTGGFQLGRLNADERLALFPDKRADHYSRFELGAAFRQLQWRGFAPLARFSIERNRSTIALYDYRRTRTEIGITRAF